MRGSFFCQSACGLPLRSPATLACVARLANLSAHPPVASLEDMRSTHLVARARQEAPRWHQRYNTPSDNVIDREAAAEYASDFRAPRVGNR
jgi:hypothetical protein